jgi:putative endonuclease
MGFAGLAAGVSGEVGCPAKPWRSGAFRRESPLHYVYLLVSEHKPSERYIGVTSDLRARLDQHNSGASPHTAKYRPWKVATYVAFAERAQAEAFEKYLKSGSGHAFARKRLWPIFP